MKCQLRGHGNKCGMVINTMDDACLIKWLLAGRGIDTTGADAAASHAAHLRIPLQRTESIARSSRE
eukprot:1192841-Alexandrium_andersonii.AAC.1